MSDQVAHQAPAARNIEAARRRVEMMKANGQLKEAEVFTFAQRGQLDDVIASIATLSKVSCDLVDRLMRSERTDALLVPCKAIDFRWSTVRVILEARNGQGCAAQDIAIAEAEYAKLSASTAGRVLRFWQVRQTAQTQVPAQSPAG
jgi:hypothetical protein